MRLTQAKQVALGHFHPEPTPHSTLDVADPTSYHALTRKGRHLSPQEQVPEDMIEHHGSGIVLREVRRLSVRIQKLGITKRPNYRG